MPHIHELNDFTTSAFILHPDEPRILLLKHRKIGKWLQPGGHIELNENPLQALHHELEEETGLKPADYDFIDQPDHPSPSGDHIVLPLPFYHFQHHYDKVHQHIDLSYLVQAKTATLTDTPDGADDIGWFDIEEIRQKHRAGELFDETLNVCEWVLKRRP